MTAEPTSQAGVGSAERAAAPRPDWLASGSRVLRGAIKGLDDHLSRTQDVRTFSDDPACILRYALTTARFGFSLSDGTEVRTGDAVADIHCWNDRVPTMPKGGPDLVWARNTSAGLRRSLQLLARAMTVAPELRDVRACRARVNFVGAGGSNESVSRIIHRLGFEDVDERPFLRTRMHDAFENILIGMLVWAHNPEALRASKLIRERRPVWSSRTRLLRLHGGATPPRS